MKKLFILSVILLAASALQGHIIRIPADYSTIQKGIDAAKIGDTVLVSPGTYVENINYKGKSITVASLFLTTRDTSCISRTIIDGNQAGSVVTFERGEKRTAVLTGFTITNGNNFNGGGIYCYLSSFTLNNIKIVNNKATHGGGIQCIMSDPLLEDVLVSGNYAGETGGGISFGQAKAGTTLKNVTIVGNTCSYDGGGIYLEGCSPILDNVTITNNTASWYGGGIYCFVNCKPTLKNVTIAHNTAVQSGGGIYCIESAPVFDRTMRCNIYFNIANQARELYSDKLFDVIVDTFTVKHPSEFYAELLPNFTFDILHGKVEQADADLYISPAGDDSNSGLTPDNPLKTIAYAFSVIRADADRQNRIILLEGTYAPSTNGEKYPLSIRNYLNLEGVDNNSVILDAEGSATVLEMSGNFSSHVSHLTVKGGTAVNGGGIYCFNSSPALEDLVITENSVHVEPNPWGGWQGGNGGGIFFNKSRPALKNVKIINNSAANQGGGLYCLESTPVFDSINRSNIYFNVAGEGNDLYSGSLIQVIVDTFSVLNPTVYHAAPLANFNFDILHGMVDPAEADVFVSPAGDNGNSGLSAADPVMTIHQAFSIIRADSLHPRTIHLLEGTYSPSATNEYFPVIIPNYISLEGVNVANVILDAEHTRRVIQFEDNKTSHLSGMTITGGSGGNGGGIYCDNSSPVLENLIITGNSAPILFGINQEPYAGCGGGIYCMNSNPVLKNLIITGNSAQSRKDWSGSWIGGSGGGAYFQNSNPSIQNARISSNMAEGSGGGICFSNSGPSLENVTIDNNKANRVGGGMVVVGLRPVFDSNHRCNIYLNSAPEGNDLYFVLPTNEHTPIEVIVDTFTVLHPGEFHAKPLPVFNFDILHGKIAQINSDLFVSSYYGDDNNSGLSAIDPLKTIRQALISIQADSLNPHMVHVLYGIYSTSGNGETFPVAVPEYVSLLATEPNVTLDSEGSPYSLWLKNNNTSSISGLTVIRAQEAGVYLNNYNGTLKNMEVVDNYGAGMIIENNSGPVLQSINVSGNLGGGIISNGSHPLLKNVTIAGNSGTGFISSYNNHPILQDVVITKNNGEYGGGMKISGTSPEFRNVMVTENTATYGGGIMCQDPVSGVTMSGNTARYGGGMYIQLNINPPAQPTFFNLVIDRNIAQFGGGIYVTSNWAGITSNLDHVTLTGNVAGFGGGIYAEKGGKALFYNSILWNDYPQEVYLDSSSFSVISSDVRGGRAGVAGNHQRIIIWDENNADTDPLFEGTGDHPFSLSSGSPCIDSGTETSGYAFPELDILGHRRKQDGNGDGIALPDMGAYEFVSTATGLEDPGLIGSDIRVRIYPNPFTSATAIEYQLSESGEVNLTIYNNIGQPVAALVNEFRPQGRQQVEWNAEGMAPGIYYFRLAAGNQVVTGRMLKF